MKLNDSIHKMIPEVLPNINVRIFEIMGGYLNASSKVIFTNSNRTVHNPVI